MQERNVILYSPAGCTWESRGLSRDKSCCRQCLSFSGAVVLAPISSLRFQCNLLVADDSGIAQPYDSLERCRGWRET